MRTSSSSQKRTLGTVRRSAERGISESESIEALEGTHPCSVFLLLDVLSVLNLWRVCFFRVACGSSPGQQMLLEISAQSLCDPNTLSLLTHNL